MTVNNTSQIQDNLLQDHIRLHKPQLESMLTRCKFTMVGSVLPRTIRNRNTPSNREVGLRLIDDKLAAGLGLVVDLSDVCERDFGVDVVGGCEDEGDVEALGLGGGCEGDEVVL